MQVFCSSPPSSFPTSPVLGAPTRSVAVPKALSQLLPIPCMSDEPSTEDELSDLFGELLAEALGNAYGWLPQALQRARSVSHVHTSAEQWRWRMPPNCSRRSPPVSADAIRFSLEMVRLAGRLKLPGAPAGMGPLLEQLCELYLKLSGVMRLTTIVKPGWTGGGGRGACSRRPSTKTIATSLITSRQISRPARHRNAFSRTDAAW